MRPRIRIVLRLLGFALLIFAGVRFVNGGGSSFHSEGSISQAEGGGYQIDHIIGIDHWTLLAGFLGIVALVASVAVRRVNVQDGQI